MIRLPTTGEHSTLPTMDPPYKEKLVWRATVPAEEPNVFNNKKITHK